MTELLEGSPFLRSPVLPDEQGGVVHFNLLPFNLYLLDLEDLF